MSKGRRSVLVGAITAPGETGSGCGMGLAGAGIERGLGLGRVVASLDAVKTVAEPRTAAIPSEGASELPPVAGAGLMRADHAETLYPSA